MNSKCRAGAGAGRAAPRECASPTARGRWRFSLGSETASSGCVSVRQSSWVPAWLLVVGAAIVSTLLAWAVDRAQLGRPARATEAPRPDAIVSLAPALTETLFAIGAGRHIVGVSDYCEVEDVTPRPPQVGSGLTPDYEGIARLAPTLILLSGHGGGARASLELLGPTRTVAWHTLQDVVAGIRTLGWLTGRETAANELAARLRARLSAEPPAHAPRVLLTYGPPVSQAGEVWYIQPGSLHDAVLRAAGGRNAVRTTTHGAPRMSLERLVAVDPDLIVILAGAGYESPAAQRRLRSDFLAIRELRAAQGQRVAVVQNPAVLATGPRIMDLVAPLARVIAQYEGPR